MFSSALRLLGVLATASSNFTSILQTDDDYFQPNSTGIKLQNGYERVYIQVSDIYSLANAI